MGDSADTPRRLRALVMDRCADYPCTTRIALAGAIGTLLLAAAQAAGLV